MIASIISAIIIINAALAMVTLLRQSRDIAATWAWLLVLMLLPVVGFVIYWLFGRKLATNKLNALATQQRLGLDQQVAAQQQALIDGRELPELSAEARDAMHLMTTLLNADGALITTGNAIELISDREQFTKQMFEDIKQAKDHVHIEAYRIVPDAIGQALLQTLVEKAKQGVRVRVLYDSFGSLRLSMRFWRPLLAVGGQVTPFIATKLGRWNPRINFRNHRKLIVIDGQIGYIGGFDIGRQPNQLQIHRDNQLRLKGAVVASLQSRFFMDWNATAKAVKVHFHSHYFPEPAVVGHSVMQLVSGGPEQPLEVLKLGYLQLVGLAKRRIWIQTPYFVPDDSLVDALVIAANAGIDVKVMVPVQTRQPLMAKATRYYLNQLAKKGVHVYLYQGGFLHAKTIVVDGRFLATGTANFDIRSMKLNFEVVGFIYDVALAQQAERRFDQDRGQTKLLTITKDATRLQQLGTELARLLAPIL